MKERAWWLRMYWQARQERTVDDMINDLTVPFDAVLQAQADQARRRQGKSG